MIARRDIPWRGAATPRALSESDYEAAAGRLGCDVAAIKAVWEVEAAGKCFRPDGTVERRFEPHYFPRQHWDAIGFSVRPGEAPWRASLRLSSEAMFQRAAAIDIAQAMRASSWGGPQIMGFNAQDAGYARAGEMVRAMAQGAPAHLDAFARLIEGWGIAGALRGHDWTAFARRYNGSGQVAEYARRMEAAYRRHSGGQRSAVVLRVGARGEAVAELQRALGIEDDGAFGPATLQAVRAFQASAGLPVDGVVGHRTWTALRSSAIVGPVPAQETVAGARVALTEQIAGAGAAATGVAGAVGQFKDALPEWAFSAALVFAACAAVVVFVLPALRRRMGRAI